MNKDEVFLSTVYTWHDVSSGFIRCSLEKPKDISESCITEITPIGLEGLQSALIGNMGVRGPGEPENERLASSFVLDMISCGKIMDNIKQMKKIIQ